MRRYALCLVALFAVILAGCADDVAPGYRIEKQEVGVRYDDGTVHIRAEYQLRNTGREPLDALRISLAAVNPGAASDMRIFVNDAQTPWMAAEEDGQRALEIKFSPAWQRRERRRLRLEYQFSTAIRVAGATAPMVQSFQLVPGSWSPELLPPPGILSKGGVAPKKWSMTVAVPNGLRVHAAGKLKGTKKAGSATEHRFEQEKSHGFAFVVAGQYDEIKVDASGHTIYFWGSYPGAIANAQRAGQRLGETLQTYREWLGPLEKDQREVRVVQGSMRYILGGAAGTRPGLAPGVISDPMILRPPGPGYEEALCIADEWLAGMWLQWLARPDLNAGGLAEQLGKHLAQARGCPYQGGSREREMEALRNGFAAASRNFEKEQGPMKESFRRERNGYRLRLQVFAMEVRAGREKMHAAIRRMLQALRGDTWSLNELRSALEAETGQEWATFFRDWANTEELPE